VVLLCYLVYCFGRWAFGEDAGTYSGMVLASCVGLYLFTRILIPDAVLTLTIALAIWAALRLLEPGETNPRWWATVLGVAFGCGLLLKGLIAVVFPVGALLVYMAVTRQIFSLTSWRKLHLGTAFLVTLVVAAPWHILATLRNPPYFAFSMHSGPGEYHGFFWFYFFNEHLLRFLNLRYPRDYNTVPRLWFWLFNLIWLFPWSVYLPGAAGLDYSPKTRAGRVRLMAVCWICFVMVFFTFSTTQEYYSMPIYPAMALLIGSTLAAQGKWTFGARWALMSLFILLSVALMTVFAVVYKIPAPGEISQALTQNPDAYTLSLGHMTDLTLKAFAYLKLALGVAAAALAFGAIAIFVVRRNLKATALVTAATMILFFQASRLALVTFDPYLGSYPLAVALKQSPDGQLVESDAYYSFSSVFFYTGRDALLWNGRVNNLEYGSYAPGAPRVFIDNQQLSSLWAGSQRCYLVTYESGLKQLEQLVGKPALHIVKQNADSYLVSNQPTP
jgi:hypothetical protein